VTGYILEMKKIFLILISLLGSVLSSNADYFGDIICDQSIATIKDYELEYANPTFAVKWYKIGDTKQKFGTIESNIVNYLFLEGKFYGKVFGIIGKDNINGILRFFKEELKRVYEAENSSKIFVDPIRRRDGSWLYMKPNQVVIVSRFSLHLGQVQILCREAWENYTGNFQENDVKN